jgi:hypothetical protein
MTDFLTTPEEAQAIALILIEVAKSDGYKCEMEQAFHDDAPLATTLLCSRKGAPTRLIEVQAQPHYTPAVRRLCQWLRAQRMYTELIIATGEGAHASGRLFKELKLDGVGLGFVHDDGDFDIPLPSTVPALIATPDPSIALGRLKKEVNALLDRFNRGDRKDALRDLCEVVERETERVAVRAARKQLVNKTVAQVEGMDWNAQIGLLGSGKASASGVALFETQLHLDMHSFRGARNLLDHKVTTAVAASKREQQFVERMIMGSRLAAELVRIDRKM